MVKTTTFYLKCANTFVEDSVLPRPGLNQVFLIGKLSVWFCFNAYIVALLLPVCSPDQSYIRVFVCDVIVMEYKIK